MLKLEEEQCNNQKKLYEEVQNQHKKDREHFQDELQRCKEEYEYHLKEERAFNRRLLDKERCRCKSDMIEITQEKHRSSLGNFRGRCQAQEQETEMVMRRSAEDHLEKEIDNQKEEDEIWKAEQADQQEEEFALDKEVQRRKKERDSRERGNIQREEEEKWVNEQNRKVDEKKWKFDEERWKHAEIMVTNQEQIPNERLGSLAISVNESTTMPTNKSKNRWSKKQHQQQPPKTTVHSSEKEEAASRGLLANVVGDVTSMVTGVAKASGLLGVSIETKSTETAKPTAEGTSLKKSVSPYFKIREEKLEKKMPVQNADDVEDNDDIRGATALSPEEKRKKLEEEGVETDVTEIIVRMTGCSNKQKKKIREKLRKEDPDLYKRYVKQLLKKPDDPYGRAFPEKKEEEMEEEENYDNDDNIKMDNGRSKEKHLYKGKDHEKNIEKKKDLDLIDGSKKAPIKVNKNTPLLQSLKHGTELTVAQEVLETPVNWEDEDWDLETSKSIEDLKNEEVEEYENELKAASGALPKDHSKVSFGFRKKEHVLDWSKENEDWTKKKDKKSAFVKHENQEPEQEDHQGARAKDGLSKSQKKKQKK